MKKTILKTLENEFGAKVEKFQFSSTKTNGYIVISGGFENHNKIAEYFKKINLKDNYNISPHFERLGFILENKSDMKKRVELEKNYRAVVRLFSWKCNKSIKKLKKFVDLHEELEEAYKLFIND